MTATLETTPQPFDPELLNEQIDDLDVRIGQALGGHSEYQDALRKPEIGPKGETIVTFSRGRSEHKQDWRVIDGSHSGGGWGLEISAGGVNRTYDSRPTGRSFNGPGNREVAYRRVAPGGNVESYFVNRTPAVHGGESVLFALVAPPAPHVR